VDHLFRAIQLRWRGHSSGDGSGNQVCGLGCGRNRVIRVNPGTLFSNIDQHKLGSLVDGAHGAGSLRVREKVQVFLAAYALI